MSDVIEQLCGREIARLHDCFERWFMGELEQTEEKFEAIRGAFADGFVHVGTDGASTDRDDLLEHLWQHWYHPADEGKTIAIETEDVRHVRSEGEVHVATYVERQRVDGNEDARRSTVVFREASDTPHGLVWLHVHETAISA